MFTEIKNGFIHGSPGTIRQKNEEFNRNFKKIIASNVYWSVSLFYLVLETLRNSNTNLSFWEGQENWASIIINNIVVGYIWQKYPLVVVENKISSEIKDILKDIEGIYFLEVDFLDVNLFKIEDDSLKVYFENFNNLNSFTLEELWFQTNSVQKATKTSASLVKTGTPME